MDAGNPSAHDGSLRGGPVPLSRTAPPDGLALPGSQTKPGNQAKDGNQTAPGRPVLPEFVITPAHPDNGSTEIVFEVRQAANGMDVLPVFSSVRHLIHTLGPEQPWVAMPLIRVRELAAAGGIQQVILDPEAQPGAWRWQESDLQTLEHNLGS